MRRPGRNRRCTRRSPNQTADVNPWMTACGLYRDAVRAGADADPLRAPSPMSLIGLSITMAPRRRRAIRWGICGDGLSDRQSPPAAAPRPVRVRSRIPGVSHSRRPGIACGACPELGGLRDHVPPLARSRVTWRPVLRELATTASSLWAARWRVQSRDSAGFCGGFVVFRARSQRCAGRHIPRDVIEGWPARHRRFRRRSRPCYDGFLCAVRASA